VVDPETGVEVLEDAEAEHPREALAGLLASWPAPRSGPSVPPLLWPKTELRLRGAWERSGLAMVRYEFKVTARRLFFGGARPVAVDRLCLHWLFDGGRTTVRIGSRTLANAASVEKRWIFERHLDRAEAWAEAWYRGRHIRSGRAVLD
jgi:hypothetical protein